MYIILIAWLYVVILMAATEKSITTGLLTFLFYGLIPCALLLWLLGVKHRRYKQSKQSLHQNIHNQDSANTQSYE
jgi:biotin transporter BioY